MAQHRDNCEICRRLADCREGRSLALIAELDHGVAVMGDSQQFEGYCLLLSKTPATELHELPAPAREGLLRELSELAEAVWRATGPLKLNYELLGNVEPHIHWHVFPRRSTDAQPLAPVWGQMHAAGSGAADECRFAEQKHGALRRQIREHLLEIRNRRAARTMASVL